VATGLSGVEQTSRHPAEPRLASGGLLRSGGAAVFVDESAEHVRPFDVPELFDAREWRFCRGHGYIEVDAAVKDDAP
jgi:hypothetical protein